jgi:hypothetical protein
VDRVISVASQDEVQRAILDAAREQKFISISRGRHSMGGQQFGTGTIAHPLTIAAGVLFAIYLAWMATHDEFIYIIAFYGLLTCLGFDHSF